jgi:hypothetical protein
MASPESLIKRAQKLERREAFFRLREAIETQPMSATKRMEFVGRIMALTTSGAITPQESRKLTNAVSKRRTAP